MPDANTELSTASKEKLVTDMKAVISDAEEILRATGRRLEREAHRNATWSSCGSLAT